MKYIYPASRHGAAQRLKDSVVQNILISRIGKHDLEAVLGNSPGPVYSAIAVLIQAPLDGFEPDKDAIRLAFDGDAVLFSDESERIYKQVRAEQGPDAAVEAFVAHEKVNAEKELPEGPFGKLLKTLARMNNRFTPEQRPVRIALVSAHSPPAHERVIRNLRAWNVDIDEAFFLGGLPKEPVLRAFRARIFFDDQYTHVNPASRSVPSGHVPYVVGSSGLNKGRI